jgi:hypothetical protein
MSNFGALTDHFGILEIEGLSEVLELTASSKTPDPMSRADAQDENGDIAAATWHGNAAGTLFDASSTFVCKSGTFSTDVLHGGEVATGKVITSISISTSNGGWPQITVSGKLGTSAIVAPTGSTNKWKMPAFTITGAKRAQLLAFTVAAACRLTDSSLEGSLDIAQAEDGLGEPVAHGISGGVLTMGASLVAVTGPCAWTPTGDWEETQAPGAEEGQASYHTATASAELVWERDAVSE